LQNQRNSSRPRAAAVAFAALKLETDCDNKKPRWSGVAGFKVRDSSGSKDANEDAPADDRAGNQAENDNPIGHNVSKSDCQIGGAANLN